MAPLHRHLVFLLVICLPLPASAQDWQRDPPPSGRATLPSNSPTSLTGKERLGRKWMDEQRIDNCNVPVGKRGTKPRPSACHHSPLSQMEPTTLRRNVPVTAGCGALHA
jgi:hypothetical protein